jgi:outer membrane protein
MKIRFAVSALAALLLMPAAWAQSNAAHAADAPSQVKIGVINVQVAITGTAEGKQAAAELQSQFAPRQSELQNLQKQIEDLQTRMRTTANTLSDDEKARLAREYDQMTRALQRKNQDYQDDTTEAQQEVVNRIGRKLVDVLDKYSRENGYTVVLDTSAQQTPVIFASNQIDVTQDIIRLYDQNYPVKASSPTRPAASVTPKPASTPSSTAPKPPAQQQPKP